MTRDVLIITVQYGNIEDTKALVESVAASRHTGALEMMIVDNGRVHDETALESIRKRAPFPVHIIRPEKNLYYWGGAARALALVSKANNHSYKWTIICNNDVVVENSEFFSRLRLLDVNRYPLVAPVIIDSETGRDQNPLLGTPPGTLKRLKWRVHDLHYLVAVSMLAINRLLGRLLVQRQPQQSDEKEQKIYAPHGAFVILSSMFFERGGKLDTTLPLYAEELSLAATAERLQLPVWHRLDLEVLHRAHSTLGTGITRAKYEMEREARRYYYRLSGGATS